MKIKITTGDENTDLFLKGVFVGMLLLYIAFVFLKPCKCPGFEAQYIWWWL